MCSHYLAALMRERLLRHFHVEMPDDAVKEEMWPRYSGLFLRRQADADGCEAVAGRWGLVPAELRPEGADKQMKLSTFNARAETAAKLFTFRGAWRHGQHCIIPAEAFFEPDWRGGRPVPARISRVDGAPMGIAGLWDAWRTPSGEVLHSYTMITINADTHTMMREFHEPGKEKRMPVVLPESEYDAWLSAPAERSMAFLVQYPADRLVAQE